MGWILSVAALAETLILFIAARWLKKLDDRNTSQHAAAEASRKRIEGLMDSRFDRLEEKVDAHLVWHATNPHLSLVKEANHR